MEFKIPAGFAHAAPDPARLAKTRKVFASTVAPVRPLPSNGVLMAIGVAAFVVLAILLAAPFGFYGFAKLGVGDRVVEYSVLLLLAFVLSGIVVEQMIPGSRRIVQPEAGVLIALLLVSLTASMLFPDFSAPNFVARGVPCLRLGILCAVPAAGLVALAMRQGFLTDPMSAAIASGALAGLLGVCVLALHCPVLNAAHIIVWHVTVVAVTAVAASLLGWRLSRFR